LCGLPSHLQDSAASFTASQHLLHRSRSAGLASASKMTSRGQRFRYLPQRAEIVRTCCGICPQVVSDSFFIHVEHFSGLSLWRRASTSTVEDVRRLVGRPRAFGDAIAVFAHRRVRRRCPRRWLRPCAAVSALEQCRPSSLKPAHAGSLHVPISVILRIGLQRLPPQRRQPQQSRGQSASPSPVPTP
jgi:hypothetical protein